MDQEDKLETGIRWPEPPGLSKKAKKKKSIKAILPVLCCAVLLLALILGLATRRNTYMTPVRAIERLESGNSLSYFQWDELARNGLMKKELREISRVLQNSDTFLNLLEEYDEELEDSRDYLRDMCGDSYKIRYVVTEKTPLTKGELQRQQDSLREVMMEYMQFAYASEDFDSKQWGELALTYRLSKAETKQFLALVGKLGENYRRLKVTEGYELEATRVLSGKDLEDEVEIDMTITVLKVNGRWVSYSVYGLADWLDEFLKLDNTLYGLLDT